MEFRKDLKLLVFDFDGTLHTMPVDWQQARKLLGITHSDEGVGHAVDRLKKENPDALKALDELERSALEAEQLDQTVVDTLKTLARQYHIAVLSRNSGEVIQEFLKRSGVSVELVIGRQDVDEMKPHPQGLQRILEQFKLQSSEALMIGDTWHDLLLARNAGCHCVIIGQNFSHETEQPEFQVADMRELKQLLMR